MSVFSFVAAVGALGGAFFLGMTQHAVIEQLQDEVRAAKSENRNLRNSLYDDDQLRTTATKAYRNGRRQLWEDIKQQWRQTSGRTVAHTSACDDFEILADEKRPHVFIRCQRPNSCGEYSDAVEV